MSGNRSVRGHTVSLSRNGRIPNGTTQPSALLFPLIPQCVALHVTGVFESVRSHPIHFLSTFKVTDCPVGRCLEEVALISMGPLT